MIEITKQELKNIRIAKREMCAVSFYVDLNDFEGFLKDLLRLSGITHRRFNELLGAKSSGHISNIVSGTSNMSMNHVVKVANMMKLNNKSKVTLYEWRAVKGGE